MISQPSEHEIDESLREPPTILERFTYSTCPPPKRLGRLETTAVRYNNNTLPRPRASSEWRSRMVVACGLSGVAIAIVKTLKDRVT
jgi:hypothetical protein